MVHLKWLWGKWIDCDEADVCYHQGGMEWQRQRCPIQSKCHKFPLLRFGNLSGGKSILGQDSNVDNRFFIIIQQPCVGIYKFYVKQTHWSYEIKKMTIWIVHNNNKDMTHLFNSTFHYLPVINLTRPVDDILYILTNIHLCSTSYTMMSRRDNI